MIEFLDLQDENEKEDLKIENFKGIILQAFPSKAMYKHLYLDGEDDEGIIEAAPTTHEEFVDIMDILHNFEMADDSEVLD